MSLQHYVVREALVAARPVAGVRAQVSRGRVAQEFGPYLDQVYAAARAGAVRLDGHNIFIYRSATAEQLTVDFWAFSSHSFDGFNFGDLCSGPAIVVGRRPAFVHCG